MASSCDPRYTGDRRLGGSGGFTVPHIVSPTAVTAITPPYVPLPHSDWEAGVVTLSARDGEDGEVAIGQDGSLQQASFSLDTCLPIPS